ncbi:MAG: hypothetical protein IJM61_06370 [Firmicutes bacterium]|nr:hypothetical protein [Bacillota bacterium]
MKKFLSVVLALVLVFSLASCGGGILSEAENIVNSAENGGQGNGSGQSGPSGPVSDPGNLAGAFVSDVMMQGNGLSDFDLKFLKLENGAENKIYSPLSIKYALQMLAEASGGDSRAQIDGVIGKYASRKYVNSANLSLANAMFIRDSFAASVKSDYTAKLKSAYDADVVTDSFASPDPLNNWVKDKTLGLIPKAVDDLTGLDYVLVNALAIDMEWVKKIQPETGSYSAYLKNESYASGDPSWPQSYGLWVGPLMAMGLHRLEFAGAKAANSVQIAAAANKYDIISALGEDNIRNTVLEEYKKYKAGGGWEYKPFDIEEYMADLKGNYGQISSSTDFLFHDDDNVKMFAKDLKTYDGATLQYVGIMPKAMPLAAFIEASDAGTINTLLSGLKPIEASSFEEGYLTIIKGYIPVFSFDYELKLKQDLMDIGITDVFDAQKADLSGLSTSQSYIGTAVHKATIDFSNDGIKAGAVTAMGGLGDAGPGFEYYWEVPVKRIDLTFNQPFMYLIRDKATGEVWFTGTVYQPTEYTGPVW